MSCVDASLCLVSRVFACVLTLICSCSYFGSSLARAQAQSACTDENGARASFERGVELAGRRNLADARTAYEQALALCPRVPAAYNLAVVELQLGEALASRDRALGIQGGELGELTQPQQRAVRQLIRRASRAIAHLNVRVSGAAADGVTLSVDGRRVASLALGEQTRVEVNPGRHLLVVTTPDGRTLESTQLVEPGQRADVELTLPLREDYGRLTVRTDSPDSVVEIVGVGRGTGELTRDLPATRYSVRLPAYGVERAVEVVAQQTVTIELDVPRGLLESPWFWVAVGGVVAVGLAVVIVAVVASSGGPVTDPTWGRVELLRAGDGVAPLLRF